MSETHKLVPSSTSGKYALDTPDGRDISSGQPLDIMLNGMWIEGRVEYAHELYVNGGLQFLGDKPHLPAPIDGYYFTSHKGVCGLCVGMTVRIPE